VPEAAEIPRTLEAAVAREVRAGLRDPVEITARLSELYGQAWLLRQFVNLVARIVHAGPAGMPRPAGPPVKSRNPSSTPAPRGGPIAPRLSRVQRAAGAAADGFFASSRWVPDAGWKRVTDLTASDCRRVAEHCALLADIAGEYGRWFALAAMSIEAHGARTLGDVTQELPPRPRYLLPAGGAKI